MTMLFFVLAICIVARFAYLIGKDIGWDDGYNEGISDSVRWAEERSKNNG